MTVEEKLESLSPPQREVYDALASGKTPEEVATQLGKPLGIINAQITRIKNKRIPIPTPDRSNETPEETVGTDARRVPKPVGSISSDQQVREQLGKVGEFKIPDEVLAQVSEAMDRRDVHPLIMIGTTVQFVRLAGGRISAHQTIEDVYEALRLFNGHGAMGEEPKETTPWSGSPEMRINALEAENAELKERIARLEAAS